MSSINGKSYWFHARRYGWGWGLPSAWQGWVVLAVYLTLLIGGIPFLLTPERITIYVAYAGGLSVALTVVCWLTGEPPRWRWGKRGP